MVSQRLELKHKRIAQEAARETGLKMLVRMKEADVPEHTIIMVTGSENIPEEDVKKILDSKQELEIKKYMMHIL